MAPPKTAPVRSLVRLNLNLPTTLIERLDAAVEAARRDPSVWPRPTRTQFIRMGIEALLAKQGTKAARSRPT